MKKELTVQRLSSNFFAFFCIFLLLHPGLMALDPNKPITQYRMNIWNIRNGLPDNSICALQQTRDGYIWLGTRMEGLVRFDGARFKVFNSSNSPLKSNFIYSLYEDRKGTLWIGTSEGGLSCIKESAFITFPVKKYPGLKKIRSINEDRWGNIWIGSDKMGLTCIRNGKFTTYTTAEGLPDNRVKCIYQDKKKDLWIATLGGIAKLVKPGIFLSYTAREGLPYTEIRCICEDSNENLWIGTDGGGLIRMKNGSFTIYKALKKLPHTIITCLFEDSDKNLWIGTDGGGLARKNKSTFDTFSAVDGLACGFIYSIYEDREGSLWVGTIMGGLHQFRDREFINYTTKENLVHDHVFSIYEDQAGDLWIGTSGGLNRMKNGKISIPLTIENSLPNKSVMCIFEDSSGYLWFGTLGGLHMFKQGKLHSFTKKIGLSDNRIRCIFEDKRGNTWIGTENGLNRFSNGKFTVFTKKEGLLSNFIKCVFEDSQGNLWIGTDAGLNRLSNGTFTAYNPGGVFESNYVRYIYEDNKGMLWFGTHRGLIRMKDEKTTIYNSQNGLTDNYIHCIIEDETGKLWLGGPKGISFVSKKQLDDFSAGRIHQLHPILYNETDGMKSQWCNSGVCKTRDEKLWFPTNGGIVIIDPKKTSKDTFLPSVIIEKFNVDGKPINLKSKEPVSLSPGKKRLEFHYTGVSFINPQKIKFKIRLKGYDRNWIDMGTARNTTYTELSPGHYTFKVIACNPDGPWNEKGASLSFYLKPHFHQTSWFYILASSSIVMMVFSLYRLRVRQLKNRERELSALVEMRTRDLKERTIDLETAHHKLKQSKEIIETKNRHIMDSIRYAQKIQQAMLPTKEKMARELTDYFVVFKPKDIVSGDFYWFDVIDDQYFLAVADCTGHGVPGALLSMIGYLMLNEAINEKRIFDPAQALSHLHQGFRSVLKQELDLEENDAYDTYDGMDVGLCRIDLSTGQITFAGARHSLFYMRNSALIEIKGNRKSIGGRQREEIRSFSSHQIDIPIKGQKEKEIMIYITTDGFADQHNPQNQKFGTRRLREFLRDNAHLNASQQKEALVKALETHQANEEQRDDITVIGIRLCIG